MVIIILVNTVVVISFSVTLCSVCTDLLDYLTDTASRCLSFLELLWSL